MNDLYQLQKVVNKLIKHLEADLAVDGESSTKGKGHWQLDTDIFSYLGINPPMRPKLEEPKQISAIRQEKLNNKQALARQLEEGPQAGLFSNIKQMFVKEETSD